MERTPIDWLDGIARNVFFTGKGGVGKTALACATAIALADSGKRVLLVSTDPASNLDEMLGTKLSNSPTQVLRVERLSAMNVEPAAAAEAYRERVLAPYRGIKTAAEINTIREQLSGACTTEIAAFDEFAGLLAGDGVAREYDHIVFDTAPTGHTLRLLQLPRAWTQFLESSAHGASCLGPHSGLTMQRDRFAAAMNALTDETRTTVMLVARPDVPSLREADRTSTELRALDVRHQELAINGVFRASDPNDTLAVALERRGLAALDSMPDSLRKLPRHEVRLRAFNMVGLDALRALAKGEDLPIDKAPASIEIPGNPGSLATLVDELSTSHGALLMVMGKGGVGKTTIAAAIAIELASREMAVHLSTTDPAAHVAATVGGEIGHLEISRIDPRAEVRAYTQRVMERKGRGLDQEGRALLEEDLRSPCTEEVAVFHAFSRLISRAREHFVVLDTAPTGHTLLLLDATGAYHRDVMRGVDEQSSSRMVTPLMRLRDPSFTKVLIVTLAETTPVSEAAQLQADLRRAGVEPYAWVINSSLAAAHPTDPLLQRRAASELAQIARVRTEFARRVYLVPLAAEEPVGEVRLRALARGMRSPR